MKYGIPQLSILCAVLFTQYIQPLVELFEGLDIYHMYAYDVQFCMQMMYNYTFVDLTHQELPDMSRCKQGDRTMSNRNEVMGDE